MNSLVKVFARVIDGKRHYYCIAPEFFVPEDTIYNTDTALKRVVDKYQKWVNSGHLTATDGAEVDIEKSKKSSKIPIKNIEFHVLLLTHTER